MATSNKSAPTQSDDNFDDNTSSGDDAQKSLDDNSIKDDLELDRLQLKQLIQDDHKFLEKIVEMNDIAVEDLNSGEQKKALLVLQRAEKILEFAASCGKSLDRNLIIVVLYNRACAYQSLWVLEKCSKYIDGVIYNLEMSLQEESQAEKNSIKSKYFKDKEKEKIIELLSYKVKKQTFLVRCYLQYCAILSQLGIHKKALDGAKKASNIVKEVFSDCYGYCKDYIKNIEVQQSQNIQILKQGQGNNKLNGIQNSNQNSLNSSKSQKYQNENINSQEFTLKQSIMQQLSQKNSNNNNQVKEEILFSKQLVEYAFNILKDLYDIVPLEEQGKSTAEHLQEARKYLYFWKNNPENNERHLRQELNAPTKICEDECRSLLGVQNQNEWIENFNIGTIMHMNPVKYDDFSFFGDIFYEISKKNILEKVIYQSICYFTIATEMRFIEIDTFKGQKCENFLASTEFKKSEVYHLKSLEIVCKYITCRSPYISHLITSYHKHYNQNLETIAEESMISQTDIQHESYIQGSQQQNSQNRLATIPNMPQIGINQGQQNYPQLKTLSQETDEQQQQKLSKTQLQYLQVSLKNEKTSKNIIYNKNTNNNQQQTQQQNQLLIQQPSQAINEAFPSFNMRNNNFVNKVQQNSQTNDEHSQQPQPKSKSPSKFLRQSPKSRKPLSPSIQQQQQQQQLQSHQQQVLHPQQIQQQQYQQSSQSQQNYTAQQLQQQPQQFTPPPSSQEQESNGKQFKSLDNSKKNSPRSILDIRKSSPLIKLEEKDLIKFQQARQQQQKLYQQQLQMKQQLQKQKGTNEFIQYRFNTYQTQNTQNTLNTMNTVQTLQTEVLDTKGDEDGNEEIDFQRLDDHNNQKQFNQYSPRQEMGSYQNNQGANNSSNKIMQALQMQQQLQFQQQQKLNKNSKESGKTERTSKDFLAHLNEDKKLIAELKASLEKSNINKVMQNAASKLDKGTLDYQKLKALTEYRIKEIPNQSNQIISNKPKTQETLRNQKKFEETLLTAQQVNKKDQTAQKQKNKSINICFNLSQQQMQQNGQFSVKNQFSSVNNVNQDDIKYLSPREKSIGIKNSNDKFSYPQQSQQMLKQIPINQN